MKRLVAIITSMAIMCSVFVSASAVNLDSVVNSEQITATTNFQDINATITQYASGKTVVESVGDGEYAVATKIGDYIYLSETVDGITTETVIDLNNLPEENANQAITPYATYETINSTYWGFSCMRSWLDEAAYGLFWSMTCDNGQYSNYDHKDSSARDYAESFWDNIVQMNDYFYQASINSTVATAGTLAGIAAAAVSSAGVLAALGAIGVVGVIATSFAAAKDEALDANYNFDRFKAIVQYM